MNKEGIKILLVEDDEDDAFFIKDLIAERELDPRPIIKHAPNPQSALDFLDHRSEERRGGQEGRSRWSPYH